MKIYHLNCGTLCPVASKVVMGSKAGLVCHCLLIESNDGLVLVDTGFGREDVLHPHARLSRTVDLIGPKFDLKKTALEQIKSLGFQPNDVRHIILTHLDMDHAGGIADFPQAKVHLYRKEFEAAAHSSFPRLSLKSVITQHRYRPVHWAHNPKWEFYDSPAGELWNGFQAVRDLKGLTDDILLIPLVGHTLGHAGVAVKTDAGWILHAGDAYFYHGEMNEPPHCTKFFDAFQRILSMDNVARVKNQGRLRKLANTSSAQVKIFCAHDHKEFTQIRSIQ